MVKLPSDKLKERRHPLRTLAIVVAGLFVLAGLTGGSWVAIATYSKDDIRASGIAHEKSQIDHKLLVAHQGKSLLPPPPPEPELLPPASSGGGGGGGGNSGAPVPFIPSSDPNNANGGDYIDPGVYCSSGSASGNPPICD